MAKWIFAVEAKPSQAKRLGFSSNAYLVAGSPFLHIFGGETKCEVTTNKSKNCVMGLCPTDIPIGDLLPRPTYAPGWGKDNGLWAYGFGSKLS